MNLPMVEKGVVDATLNLTSLCSLMVFCLLTASMSQLMDKCFQKGMIFRKYYNLICYHFWLPKKKEIRGRYIEVGSSLSFCPLNREAPKSYWQTSAKFIKNKNQWLFKILGGCIYCFSAWTYIIIALFLLCVTEFELSRPLIVLFFLGLGGNYFFIEAIQKLKA